MTYRNGAYLTFVLFGGGLLVFVAGVAWYFLGGGSVPLPLGQQPPPIAPWLIILGLFAHGAGWVFGVAVFVQWLFVGQHRPRRRPAGPGFPVVPKRNVPPGKDRR